VIRHFQLCMPYGIRNISDGILIGRHETTAHRLGRGRRGLTGAGNAVKAEPWPADKSVLTLSTPRRYRNNEHLRFVAQQPCLLCGRKPSDAHQIRFVQPRALGRKASDEFAVPLCRTHHRAVHRTGDEKAWWQQTGIDPLKVARKLWKLTRIHEPRVASATPTQDAAAERPAASGGQGPATPAIA
jgi:hypothetical protein